jgi:two-component system chemotaxis response regulator CheY
MPRKILVVDDSMLMQRLYDLALRDYESHCIEAYYASDGAEALAQLDAHPDVSAVLLDMHMPDMTGLDVLHRVKAETAWRDIPVILQTAVEGRADIERALAAGAWSYLAKPFSPEQLHRMLDGVLS